MIEKPHPAGAWCGGLFLLCFGIGLIFLANFIPPHLPSATAAEISALYQANTTGIRLGMVFVMLAATLYLPWVVLLSALIRRMDGGSSRFLSHCQALGGLSASMFFVLPALIWQVAAFRPERSPELVQLLNDAAWLFLVTPVPPFVLQYGALAVAILKNRQQPALLPRWMGFFTVWLCVLFLPGMVAYFFKTGPFAWNGLLAFWVPLAAFGIWFTCMLTLVFRAIQSLEPHKP